MSNFQRTLVIFVLVIVLLLLSLVWYVYTHKSNVAPNTPVSSTASVDATLLSVFPTSPVPEAENAKPTMNSEYSPSGSTWAKTMNEQDVFQQLLSDSASDVSTQWQAGIGKGGQLYSLRTPAGEVVVPQGNPGSDWMDGVFQTTALDSTKNIQNPPKGTIYSPQYALQAGVYQHDPSFSGLFYSPLLA